MVLSDIEIKAEIDAERLVFDPPIAYDDDRIDSSAVDLLLHPDLILLPLERVQGITIVPSDEGLTVFRAFFRAATIVALAAIPFALLRAGSERTENS